MKICHVAAELAPIAKVGGLADVVYGLGRETLHRGHPTTVIIPKYDILLSDEVDNLTCLTDDYTVLFRGEKFLNSVWTGTVGGLQVYFIDPFNHSYYFNRGCIYGCEDDVERFLYFSTAAWQFIKETIHPDILHLHDWQTAVIAVISHEEKKNHDFIAPSIMFTLHNVEYQGRCSPHELTKIGLDVNEYYVPEKMQDDVYPEALNLMKGGIVYSDFVTTVSQTYAEEVKESSLGNGLENILKMKGDKFAGIINGIDYDYWNPETDRYLPSHYSSKGELDAKMKHATINSKGYVKKNLREKLKLQEVHRPIIGIIARLVPQKGVELIKHAMKAVVKKGGQFVLLGSSPIPSINDEFHALKRLYADHPHIYISLQHQEVLAHLIYAGSDIFIVPSIFEPCGLTQLIALRYGTIPLVRETGGLKDTVFDTDNDAPVLSKARGYTFSEPTVEAFDQALDRSIHFWRNHHDQWENMVIEGMNHDFSWKIPGEEYLKRYEQILS